MTKEFTINDLLRSTKSVDKFGELAVLIELFKKGFSVEWHGSRSSFDILADSIKVEVKSCNYDNDWAKKDNIIGGFDRINPEKFDYLVCVSFDGNFDNIRFFIFNKKEVKTFSDVKWKNSPGLKNLTLVKDDKKSQRLIKISEGRWG